MEVTSSSNLHSVGILLFPFYRYKNSWKVSLTSIVVRKGKYTQINAETRSGLFIVAVSVVHAFSEFLDASLDNFLKFFFRISGKSAFKNCPPTFYGSYFCWNYESLLRKLKMISWKEQRIPHFIEKFPT